LRKIIADYMEVNPNDIIFQYTPKGKPYISNSPIHFNLSHSNEIAVYAVTFNKKVGIDIEYNSNISSILELSYANFSKKECALISTLSLPEKQKMFFKLWTIKEAYLKATGEGIENLELIEIHQDEKENFFIHHKNKPEQTKKWNIYDLDIDHNYYGTCIIEK
jgi:4'-phosphopantetheinyl transferase